MKTYPGQITPTAAGAAIITPTTNIRLPFIVNKIPSCKQFFLML